MMVVTREILDESTRLINGISARGQQMISNALTNAEWSTIAELRTIISEAMIQLCSVFTGDVSLVSSQLYNHIRTLSVGAPLEVPIDAPYNPAATDGAVRALVASVVKTGSTEQFRTQIMERVDFEMKRTAGETMFRLGDADPLEVRFARVPTGDETCDFCIMLASRGFVYRSKRKAGEDEFHGTKLDHYHAHCDCRIVPSFASSTEIEGYDPDALYDKWKSKDKAK